MLTQAEMLVVFVRSEIISCGSHLDGMTAGKKAKGLNLCLSILRKCHSDEADVEMHLVERGKPLE